MAEGAKQPGLGDTFSLVSTFYEESMGFTSKP